MLRLVVLAVFCLYLVANEAAPAEADFELTQEDFVELSSIKARARNLPLRSRCSAYLNKLHELGEQDDSSRVFSQVLVAIGKRPTKGSHLQLVSDLEECQRLLEAKADNKLSEEQKSTELINEREDSKNCKDLEAKLEILQREFDKIKDETAREKAELMRQLEEATENNSYLSNNLNAKQARINSLTESSRRKVEVARKELAAARLEAQRKLDSELAKERARHDEEIMELKRDLEAALKQEKYLRKQLAEMREQRRQTNVFCAPNFGRNGCYY